MKKKKNSEEKIVSFIEIPKFDPKLQKKEDFYLSSSTTIRSLYSHNLEM